VHPRQAEEGVGSHEDGATGILAEWIDLREGAEPRGGDARLADVDKVLELPEARLEPRVRHEGPRVRLKLLVRQCAPSATPDDPVHEVETVRGRHGAKSMAFSAPLARRGVAALVRVDAV